MAATVQDYVLVLRTWHLRTSDEEVIERTRRNSFLVKCPLVDNSSL